MTRLAGLIVLALCVAGRSAGANQFSVAEDTSPFPPSGIITPFGAKTTLTATVACGGKRPLHLDLPTGADVSSISEPEWESDLGGPLYLAAEQDEVDPTSLLVVLRYGDRTVRGVMPVAQNASFRFAAYGCQAGLAVELEDRFLAQPTMPAYTAPQELVPFPAEKQ